MLIYVACVAISMKSSAVDNKMAATSLRFRRACEEDLDKRLSDLYKTFFSFVITIHVIEISSS